MEESVSVSSDENDQSKKSKKMSKLRLEAQKYREDLDHRGVIYLSRIPPHMKPNKAQAIFQDFGEVTRLYLAEEGDQLVKCFYSLYFLEMSLLEFNNSPIYM